MSKLNKSMRNRSRKHTGGKCPCMAKMFGGACGAGCSGSLSGTNYPVGYMSGGLRKQRKSKQRTQRKSKQRTQRKSKQRV
jgi:hypothetical protein